MPRTVDVAEIDPLPDAGMRAAPDPIENARPGNREVFLLQLHERERAASRFARVISRAKRSASCSWAWLYALAIGSSPSEPTCKRSKMSGTDATSESRSKPNRPCERDQPTSGRVHPVKGLQA